MADTKVAIITLNYNGKEDTLDLLESLKKVNISGLDVQTVVLDNGSKDGLVSKLLRDFPKVTTLQNGENLGFSGGYNRGVDYAMSWGADYLFVINNDTLINSPNILHQLIKTLESDKKIGVVSPKIYFAKGFEYHKDKYRQDELGKVLWYAGGFFDWQNILSVHRGLDEVDTGQYDLEEETNLICGGCFLIKREVLEMIGLFDENYFLYFEDSDFFKRVDEEGFKKYYNGSVSIYHKVSQTAGIGSDLTDYYHTRNRLIFGMKYASTRTKFALFREALKFLFLGRRAQKIGVIDFFKGKRGKFSQTSDNPPDESNVEYPFKLSIVIVNYNTAKLTKKLLKSIFDKKSGLEKQPSEVILLDNGKLDPCEKLTYEFPKVKYLQNLQNEGFSKGYNKAMKVSSGEYILMLNSDIEILENGLSELVKYEDQFKGEAVLGGRLYFPDKTNQDSAFHLPTIWGAIKEYFLFQKGSYFMYIPKEDEASRVEGLVMACFLIPRKVLKKAGYLDENTFIFFEDIEYCRRLKKLGISIYFIPSAKFIHVHGGSTKRLGDDAFEMLKISSKHYHGEAYYMLLSFVLKVAQKLNFVKTPVSRKLGVEQ